MCDGAGGCLNPQRPTGSSCGDSGSSQCDLPDTCSAAGVCEPNNIADGTGCNDDLFCTVTDTCQAGACTGAGDPCDGLPVCQNVCNEAAENCIAPAGTSCDDDEPCNGDATCDGAGTCVHGPPLQEEAPCDDGNTCTLLDRCTGGVCGGLGSYVAERTIKISNSATVNSTYAAYGESGLASIGKQSTMPDGSRIMGNTVRLGSGSSVFDVRANVLKAKNAEVRGTLDALTVPIGSLRCTLPVVAPCEGPDVVLTEREELTLEPGNYGKLISGEGAIVTLEPGVYSFCGWRAGRSTQIISNPGGETTIHIGRTMLLRNGSSLTPAPGVPRPTVFIHAGSSRVGSGGLVVAHIVAPNSLAKFGRGTAVDGTVCAKNVKGAWNVQMGCTEF